MEHLGGYLKPIGLRIIVMRVYGHPISIMTFQVLNLMAEKSVEAELTIVDVYAGEQKHPAHCARHPWGHIPVIEDDGFWLYETPAILRYVDERVQGPSFTPTSLRERARMDQWLCNEQAYLKPVMGKLFARVGAKIFGMPDPGPERVEQGRAEAVRVFDIAASQLDESRYFGGNAPSLADLSWSAFIPHMLDGGCGGMIAARPSLAGWWERMRQRKAFHQTSVRMAQLRA